MTRQEKNIFSERFDITHDGYRPEPIVLHFHGGIARLCICELGEHAFECVYCLLRNNLHNYFMYIFIFWLYLIFNGTLDCRYAARSVPATEMSWLKTS